MTEKFKSGDRVRAIKAVDGKSSLIGKIGIVRGYNSPREVGIEFEERFNGGHNLSGRCPDGYGRWGNEECFELVKAGKSVKEKDPKYLLKYDLDHDPIEEFETLAEVRARIKEIVKDHPRDLKRDSMVVYEIKKKAKVVLDTAVQIKGL